MVMASADIQDLVFNLVTDNSSAVAGIKEIIDLQNQSLQNNANYQAMLQATMEVYGVSAEEAAAKLQEFVGVEQEVVTTTEEAGTAAEDAGTKFQGFGALGVAAGMLLVQAISGIKQIFQDALDNVVAMSQALVELNAGVNAMNTQGFSTSLSDMNKNITELMAQFPAFSRLDFTQATAQATYLGQALGLDEDQVIGLVKASAALSEITGQDLNSSVQLLLKSLDNLTTSYSRNVFGALGIVVDKTAVYNEAVAEGIAGSAKTYDALTEQAKAQAGLAIIMEQSNKLTQDNNGYNDTLVGTVKSLNSELTNEKTILGNEVAPIWVAFLQALVIGLNAVTTILAITLAEIETLRNAVTSGDWTNLPEKAQQIANSLLGINTTEAHPHAPLTPLAAGAGEAGGGTPPITPDQLKSMEKEIIDIEDDAAAQREKIATDLARKLDDINENANFKAMQAQENYLADVSKVTEDAAEQAAQSDQKYKDNSLNNELEYQNKLAALKEQFLYNLEDALRARNAGAVLKDLEKYQLDRDNAARDYALKQLTEAQQHAQDLEKLKQDENDKLQVLADAYALKQKQDEEQRAKDLADAQKDSQRQMEDLDTDTNNKLKKLADGWVAEYNLDATEAKQIYDMLYGYFGPNGAVDALYKYLLAEINAMKAAAGMGSGSSIPGESGASTGANPSNSAFGNATGVTATSSNLSSLTTGASFQTNPNQSSLAVQISLSNGLEASIINRALGNVQTSIDKVNREA